jgi:nucleoside-diphosphate-sugar epimerase
MKIVMTGGSGFLGQIILKELSRYKVVTISRSGSDINVDLSKEVPSLPTVDLIIHCAGKAHSVPKTEEEKQAFFDVNLKGTANLLSGLEKANSLPKSFVFISTVAVYGCETGVMINENYPLNARDAYGLSKIEAEKLVQSWCNKNNVICSILRLPLLVGENPPGNLGAMINAIKRGYYFNISGGTAKKSMVLGDDVAKIILKAAEIGGTYNLTDGENPAFFALSSYIASELNKSKPKNIPAWLAKLMGRIGDLFGRKSPINSAKLSKITSDLTFDDAKARIVLGWKPSSIVGGFKIKI